MFNFSKDKIKGIIIGIIGTSLITTSLFSFGEGILKTIQVTENSIKLKVNGTDLTAPNFLHEGRTYIQLRNLTDALGKDVGWDANTGTVSIGEKGTVSNVPLKTVETKPIPLSDDPQAQFVYYIEDFLYREHYGEIEPSWNGATKLWFKAKNIAQKNYSYDIRKTDSIVSPLTATVTFTIERLLTKAHVDKNEAMSDNNFTPMEDERFRTTQYRYDYTYQNGKWIYKGKASINPFNGEWEETGMKYSELDCFGSDAK